MAESKVILMTMISDNIKIPFIFDERCVSLGLRYYITWKPSTEPHMAIFGNTGSGKTVLGKILLAKTALYVKSAQLYVCEFKGDTDFDTLEGTNRFYRFRACADGLQHFYERFQKRQSGEDTARNMLVLFFDEWAAYCNSIDDKKVLEAEKRKLATLLMLGRSFSCHTLLSQQRIDSVYFNTARDNFNIAIGLGNLSEESKNMLFHEFKKSMMPNRRRGTGYMLVNGTNFTAVQVPKIKNWHKLHEAIRQGVSR